jgi:hypothetical protein
LRIFKYYNVKLKDMEALIKMVSEKTGISQEQAKQAVDTVVDFIKDKLPGGIGAQVESFVKGGSGSTSGTNAGGIIDDLKDKASGLWGK